MIINKPQFDLEKIKPGQPYWLTKNDGFNKRINKPCIIKRANPLSLTVIYFNDYNGMEEAMIKIQDITNKTATLDKMVVELEEI